MISRVLKVKKHQEVQSLMLVSHIYVFLFSKSIEKVIDFGEDIGYRLMCEASARDVVGLVCSR